MQFSLPTVHKGNAIVQRARLDHLNAQHLRAVVGVSPTLVSDRTTTVLPAVSNGLDKPTPLQSQLHPPDLARIRSAVMKDLISKGVSPLELQDDVLDSLIYAHVSKATRVTDFAPMLLPFVVSEEVFRNSIRPQAWESKLVAHACQALLTKSGYASDTSPVDAELSAAPRLIMLCAPALRSVADTWLRTANFSRSATIHDAHEAFQVLKAAATTCGIPSRQVMTATRLALIGIEAGPPISEMLVLLGLHRAAGRLLDAVGPQ